MDSFENTCVKTLQGSDFENDKPWILKDKRCSFVLWYAPWCGHCQNFKPEYSRFSDISQFLHVYAINGDSENTLIDKINESPDSPLKIAGFPSVWIFKGGIPIEQYNGPRTWQSLLEKGKQICDEKCTCSSFS